uniref:Appetite-regulating hormone n=1 Tax=Saimiri boliviensis boliviensis TaxID=39432 RepID=A0A2K6S1J0_SAIBB
VFTRWWSYLRSTLAALPGEASGVQFNAPFDVGIKLSGVQYQQHSQALGKFLQDILWEEAKEAPADK